MKKTTAPCPPIPIVLIGAVVDGRPDFATVGDCAVLCLNPPLVVVSLAATHHTTRGVLAHKAFSISVPTESMIEIIDAFGMVSGRDPRVRAGSPHRHSSRA